MLNRRQVALGLSALGTAMTPVRGFAQPSRLQLSPDLLTRMGETFQAAVDAGERAGYAILVQQAGETLYERGIGWADLEARRPVEANTKFRLASLTKPITSVAAMILVEEARLRLSDPLWRYIPEFAEARVAVSLSEDGELVTEPPRRDPTVADLMSHTAGILGRTRSLVTTAQVYAEYGATFFDPGTVEDMARRIAELPLIAHPGEAWTYGIFATDVLGRVVEVAAEMPLEDFVRSRILGPLGLEDTVYLVAGRETRNLASIYHHDDTGALEPVAVHNLDRMPAPSGGGGLASTARDYARFAAMLLNDGSLDGVRILSPASVAQMSRNVLPTALMPIELEVTTPAAGFGLGLGVCVDGHALPHSPLHAGDVWWAGSTDTYFIVSPHNDMLGVILSQYAPNQNTKSWRTWTDFTALLYGALT
ncbi:MAG: beta-lactamase family protein [Hyphomonadaceae bacterium]|nr:beta-lactamase family protein [Hyphomonadaceae bacterium]